MRRLRAEDVPDKPNVASPLPFPGRWPTRWWLVVKIPPRGEKKWEYLGKPAREKLEELRRYVRQAPGGLTVTLCEFDRGGLLFMAVRGFPDGDAERKTFDPKDLGGLLGPNWGLYHPAGPAQMIWVYGAHKLLTLKTQLGPLRFYSCGALGSDWKTGYRRLMLQRELLLQRHQDWIELEGGDVEGVG